MDYIILGLEIMMVFTAIAIGLLLYAAKSKYKNIALILNLTASGNVTYEKAKYGFASRRGKQEWRLYKSWINIFKKIELPPVPNNLEIPSAKKANTNVCMFIAVDRETFIPASPKILANDNVGGLVRNLIAKFLKMEQGTIRGDETNTVFELVPSGQKHKFYMPSAMFFDVNSVQLSGNFQLAKEFLATQHKKHLAMFTEPSWWDKYGSQAIFLTAMVMSIIVLVIVLNSDVATQGLATSAPSPGIFDKMSGAIT